MHVFRKFIIVIALALVLVPKDGFSQYQFPMKPFLSYFKDRTGNRDISVNPWVPNPLEYLNVRNFDVR